METLLHWDRELFYALNHGLNHPLLDPVMWLITSLGLGWVQMLVVLAAWGVWEWRRRSALTVLADKGAIAEFSEKRHASDLSTLTPLPPLSVYGEGGNAALRPHGSPAPFTERGQEGEVQQAETTLTPPAPLPHAVGEGGVNSPLPRHGRGAGGECFPSGFKTIFLPALIAFVGSGLTAQLIKRTLPRLRPSNLPDAIVAPDERIFHNSFPSGHTTTAFALAFWVFLATRGTRYRLWGYTALVLAGLVGLSRVYRGVHYPSDVLAGALIGVLWGAVAYFILNAPRRQDVQQPPPK